MFGLFPKTITIEFPALDRWRQYLESQDRTQAEIDVMTATVRKIVTELAQSREALSRAAK